jgi:hypothetical protein
LREVLGLKEDESSPFIRRLEIDHANISAECKKALSFEAQKKSWKDFGFNLVQTLAISVPSGVGVGALVAYATSRPYSTIMKAAGVVGILLGLIIVVSSADKSHSELNLKAKMEQGWMRDKLEEVTAKYKAACQAVRDCTDENFNKPENLTEIKTRDQLGLLVNYFTSASRGFF